MHFRPRCVVWIVYAFRLGGLRADGWFRWGGLRAERLVSFGWIMRGMVGFVWVDYMWAVDVVWVGLRGKI